MSEPIRLDILEPGPFHGRASRDVLSRWLTEGTVVACDVVWAEVATVDSCYREMQAQLSEALETLDVDYSDAPG